MKIKKNTFYSELLKLSRAYLSIISLFLYSHAWN